MSTTETEPYEQLLAHVELELELAGLGELEQLERMAARWGQLTAQMPATPPTGAAELIERTRLMHERAHIELLRLRELLLTDLSRVRRGRRAASGYGAGTEPQRGYVQSA